MALKSDEGPTLEELLTPKNFRRTDTTFFTDSRMHWKHAKPLAERIVRNPANIPFTGLVELQAALSLYEAYIWRGTLGGIIPVLVARSESGKTVYSNNEVTLLSPADIACLHNPKGYTQEEITRREQEGKNAFLYSVSPWTLIQSQTAKVFHGRRLGDFVASTKQGLNYEWVHEEEGQRLTVEYRVFFDEGRLTTPNGFRAEMRIQNSEGTILHRYCVQVTRRNGVLMPSMSGQSGQSYYVGAPNGTWTEREGLGDVEHQKGHIDYPTTIQNIIALPQQPKEGIMKPTILQTQDPAW